MAINHFLIIYNLRNRELADFVEFGSDVESAAEAYAETEREYGERPDRYDYEIVLLGSDSRETLEVTHSRYFKHGERVPF
jgi:sulfite reductase beta subunit-like hemoprotein